MAEKPPAATSLPPDVALSGTATDCINAFRLLVGGVNVGAFDPDRNPGMLKLLRGMDSMDLSDSRSWPEFHIPYSQVLKFADTATAISRDTSDSQGAFVLRSPSRDSVLVIAYAEDTEDEFYYQYQLVGGRSNTEVTLDMTRGGCAHLAPDAPLFVPPPDTSPILAVGLSCSPDTVSRGDTLSLVMPVPHGQQLALVQPNGTWFYLIQPAHPATPNNSAVPSDSFRTMSTYRIPAEVRARPYVAGRDTLEAVFVEPGNYTVIMGEQLATDHGPPFAKCQVTFR